MTAQLFDGAAFARTLKDALRPRVEALAKARGRAPALAIVSTAADAGAQSYLLAKARAFAELGMKAEIHALSQWAAQNQVVELLGQLGREPGVDAVIVDLPLPKHVDSLQVLSAIPAAKDADAQSPERLGELFTVKSWEELEKRRLIAPCTGLAVALIARALAGELSGKRVAVVGRSSVVGKPAAHLLLAQDATVTLCHSKTSALSEEVARADVVIACAGKAGLVKAEWIKPGAVVIDAGINSIDGRLRGDVEAAAAERAAHLTPVPGGVGPVTTAVLLSNVAALAERAR